MEITDDWQSNRSFPGSNGIMLEMEIATDVTFCFPNSNKKVKAHKYMLMSRSHVFYRMFTSSGFKDSQQNINIQDIEPDMFKDFLRFLYCGEDRKVIAKNALHMLYSAEKYGITALKELCLKQLEETISSRTVVLFLEMALMYNANVLKNKCLDFFSQPCAKRLAVLKNHHMSPNALKELLDHESMCYSKVEIFNACNAWAHEECVKQSLDPTTGNKRKVLGGILPKIPFQDMTTKEFADHVSPVGLLTLEEEVWIFRCLASGKRSPYVSKENICPVIVKLPTEINIPYNTTNGFQIEIKCCKKFRLVGFSFSTVGKFHMNINKNCEEFSVSEAGIKMTGHYGMDHELIIMDGWFQTTSKRDGAVPFSIRCRDGQVEFLGRAYISTLIPFEAILVDLEGV